MDSTIAQSTFNSDVIAIITVQRPSIDADLPIIKTEIEVGTLILTTNNPTFPYDITITKEQADSLNFLNTARLKYYYYNKPYDLYAYRYENNLIYIKDAEITADTVLYDADGNINTDADWAVVQVDDIYEIQYDGNTAEYSENDDINKVLKTNTVNIGELTSNFILEDLKAYYSNLLIIQYNGKHRATATIKMLAKLMWANMTLMQIRDSFDWRTAKGLQLDIIGQWVGVDRYISKQMYDDHSWFSLIEVSGATSVWQGGFSEVSNFDTVEGGFLTDPLVTAYETNLTDDNFRFLIGLKIIKNNISHFCKDIDDAFYNFANGDIVTKWDLTNKKLIYKYPASYEEIMEVAEAKGVLPCPPTCTIKLEENLNAN